jgi:hypothetical protein
MLSYLVFDYRAFKLNNILYNLFKEHSKLDMAKCFSWQKGNTIGLYKLDDNTNKLKTTLPSFENIEFANKYAYKDSLDYAFFIKQGRPFFAYHYFIQNQLKKFGKINKTL